jgi:hypothetical protein
MSVLGLVGLESHGGGKWLAGFDDRFMLSAWPRASRSRRFRARRFAPHGAKPHALSDIVEFVERQIGRGERLRNRSFKLRG